MIITYKIATYDGIYDSLLKDTLHQGFLSDGTHFVKTSIDQNKPLLGGNYKHFLFNNYGLLFDELLCNVGRNENVYEHFKRQRPNIDWNNAVMVFKVTNMHPMSTRYDKLPAISSLEESILTLRRHLLVDYPEKKVLIDKQLNNKKHIKFYTIIVQLLPKAFDKVEQLYKICM